MNPAGILAVSTKGRAGGIKGKDMVNWTEIEEPQVYINLINKIKEKTSGQSLAQWEVDNWNRRNYKSVSYEK